MTVPDPNKSRCTRRQTARVVPALPASAANIAVERIEAECNEQHSARQRERERENEAQIQIQEPQIQILWESECKCSFEQVARRCCNAKPSRNFTRVVELCNCNCNICCNICAPAQALRELSELERETCWKTSFLAPRHWKKRKYIFYFEQKKTIKPRAERARWQPDEAVASGCARWLVGCEVNEPFEGSTCVVGDASRVSCKTSLLRLTLLLAAAAVAFFLCFWRSFLRNFTVNHFLLERQVKAAATATATATLCNQKKIHTKIKRSIQQLVKQLPLLLSFSLPFS